MKDPKGFQNGTNSSCPPSYKHSISTDDDSNALHPFHTQFACLSMHTSDKIRLLQFRSSDEQKVEQIIGSTWSKGIQNTRTYGAAREFKLYGYPWLSVTNWSEEKLNSRVPMCATLGGLYENGWSLKAAVDMSMKKSDRGAYVHRYFIRLTPRQIPFSFVISNRILLLQHGSASHSTTVTRYMS